MAGLLLEKQTICICTVCGNARDDIAGDGTWDTPETLIRRYEIPEEDVTFSRTICPRCFMHYKEQLIHS